MLRERRRELGGGRARRFALAVAFAGAVLAAASAPAHAQREIPPPPSQYVYDEADWFSPAEERQLAAKLAEFERSSSNQILVAIFRGLEGEELADFSVRVAEAWGIGQQGRDNGILLALYSDDRKIDIEVGYGLEGTVTDLVAARILDEDLRPALRAGRSYSGVVTAVDHLMAATRGEYEGTGRANADRRRRDDGGGGWGFLIWILPFLFAMLFGGRRGRRSYMSPWILTSGGMGRSGRRSGGGFGGFGGGGGGGGFLGGGGSFGGGGARGGW